MDGPQRGPHPSAICDGNSVLQSITNAGFTRTNHHRHACDPDADRDSDAESFRVVDIRSFDGHGDTDRHAHSIRDGDAF